MKRIFPFFLLLVLLFYCPLMIKAQSRKIISQYQEIHGYYNPSLSGYQGSSVKTLVRNQWGPLDRNPRSYFVGGDLDFSDLSGTPDSSVEGKNAMGVSLLADGHGAFKENQLQINYASRIRVSEKANLRLGAGLFYQAVRLDGNLLTFEQQNDPRLSEFIGKISDQQFFDFNLGMSLTHSNYYFGYALHRLNSGNISSGDSFIELLPKEHLIQAGFNNQINSSLKFSTDLLFRSWKEGKDILEVNLKMWFKDSFWLGAGHRFDYASNIQTGIQIKNIRFGFVYELPSTGSYLLPGNIQEFIFSYSLFQ